MASLDLPCFHNSHYHLLYKNPRTSSISQFQKMSDHIPFEIQEEIMKRLPVKSLINFRSVSKAWKSLIDSPQFIYAHSDRYSHSHYLLVGYAERYDNDKAYVSILDDDTSPREKLDLILPLSVKRLTDSRVVGISHGLFCLYGSYEHPGDSDDFENVVVLWNPSIRKSITINLPDIPYFLETVFGFGVCSVTRDPKILLASRYIRVINEDSFSAQVKVFTLSSGAWQTTTIKLPFDSAEWTRSQAVVDGFIYWLVSNGSFVGVDGDHRFIMSFDLANDAFKEVYLPESLAAKHSINLFVSKLRDSLAVIDNCRDNQCCDVWIMDDGVPSLFIKIFTINSSVVNDVLGFKKDGQPILEMQRFHLGIQSGALLGFYNPASKDFHFSQIFGRQFTFSAYSYTETLLLLNQKDFGYFL